MTRPRRLATLALALSCGLMALLSSPGRGWAHRLSPALLTLEESAPARFLVIWKLETNDVARVEPGGPIDPAAIPQLPAACRSLGSPVEVPVERGILARWTVDCEGGLEGGVIRLPDAPSVDALLRIIWRDGREITELLRGASARYEVPLGPLPSAGRGGVSVAGAYVALGVEHILGGVDHLLFVFALLLLVGGGVPLLKTITAFTLAHSVTLALSATGLVRLPAPPVEAAIALSIVFVAAELARAAPASRRRRGRHGAAGVAFAFGLLHGFGFAGALRALGLPEEHLATALLSFNLGVELGQLVFVSALLAAGAVVARSLPMLSSRRALLARLTAYGVGALATAWAIERVVAFWSVGGGA